MTLEFIPSNKGKQDYIVGLTAHMNQALREGKREVEGRINVDTGALAASTEVEPARNRRDGRGIESRYLAGQDNLNPKSQQPTSTYARFVQARFKSVVDPFRDGYLRGITKRVNL